MNYIYDVEGIGLVSTFLFDDQLETEKTDFLRKDITANLIRIEDGQVRNIRELSTLECQGEFQDENDGRHYMILSIDERTIKVYFNEFYSFPYKEILRLRTEKKEVCSDLLYSAFMGQTESIAMIVPLNGDWHTTVRNVLCVPTPTTLRPKKDWHYKMELLPMDKNIASISTGMDTYTTDIFSMINNGTIILVHREEYVQKIEIASNEINKKLCKKFSIKKLDNAEIVSIPMMNEEGSIVYVKGLLTEILEEKISCLLPITL